MKTILFICLLSVIFPTYSKACDCDKQRQPMQKLLKSSKIVFTGTVISSKRSSFRDSITYDTYQEMVLRIDSLIAGDFIKSEITIFTEHSDCGEFLQKDDKYLVYAFVNMQNNLLLMHQCHSPCPEINTEFAKKDLEEIRKLRQTN